ncbi:MAG: methyltransferase [Synergistaceae bacterium]|jgi:tRNA1(Val) A37 N6-methylase TrmN6|nr:methyltransferase [Synergistaceae bacterium]
MKTDESAVAKEAKNSQPDDLLFGALRIFQPDGGTGPRVNVDTVLLAHFARFADRARAVEFGCAQGAVSLILAMRRKKRSAAHVMESEASAALPARGHRPIDAFDINPALIDLARENAKLNGLSEDVNFFVADLREHRKNFTSGSYDAVVMNPPYDEPDKSRPSPNGALASALHGACCGLTDVVAAAKYLLDNRGKLFLVMRAKRTGELFSLLSLNNVRPKRMRAVHPRPGGPASVVLVEAMRSSGDGLIIEPPLFICGPDGKYTRELLEAYALDGGSLCRS